MDSSEPENTAEVPVAVEETDPVAVEETDPVRVEVAVPVRVEVTVAVAVVASVGAALGDKDIEAENDPFEDLDPFGALVPFADLEPFEALVLPLFEDLELRKTSDVASSGGKIAPVDGSGKALSCSQHNIFAEH